MVIDSFAYLYRIFDEIQRDYLFCELEYADDYSEGVEKEWENQYNADEAIVLTSSFKVFLGRRRIVIPGRYISRLGMDPYER